MSYSLEYIAKGIVNLLLSIVGVFLGLRIILRLFSANAGNDFVDFIYRTSGEIIDPFRGIFSNPNLGDGIVIDFTSIFALVMYSLLGLLAFYIIDILTPSKTKKKR